MCDEMQAEVERILLDHLATAEARVVLERNPRIPLDKKHEITTKPIFVLLVQR